LGDQALLFNNLFTLYFTHYSSEVVFMMI